MMVSLEIYNGYKSVFTNPWLLRQKNRSSIKGLGKNEQKEWTHSLFAVQIVRNHLDVVELTPRSKCVYTRHLDLCHATSGVLTSQPPEHAKIGMRVKTLSDRRHNKILRVNTASGANWLMQHLYYSINWLWLVTAFFSISLMRFTAYQYVLEAVSLSSMGRYFSLVRRPCFLLTLLRIVLANARMSSLDDVWRQKIFNMFSIKKRKKE